ncbi:MAG: hypothetical protein AAF431_10705 [Pseudomonadota bacterium]
MVLVLNNYLLLNFIGYFSDSPKSTCQTLSEQLCVLEPGTRSVSASDQVSNLDVSEGQSSPSDPVQNVITDDWAINDDNDEFAASFRRLSKMEDFTDIMDEYTMTSGQRLMEIQQEFLQMSAQELYELAASAESGLDRAMALQTLSEGKISNLGVYELKSLYQLPDLDIWTRSKIVQTLMEEDDHDGIEWARQIVSTQSQSVYVSYSLLEAVYERDAEFVRGYLDQIDLEEQSVTPGLKYFLSQQPDLAGDFLQRNLDAILNSSNQRVYHLRTIGAKVELNNQQESQLLHLLESRNSNKRNFAIGLLSNVDDTDTLRRAYASLTKRVEKREFLNGLRSDKEAFEKLELAKQLAEESGFAEESNSFR